MKKFLFICCTYLLLNNHAVYAILPPLYEGIKELTAILKDPRLGELLHSGEVIISITKSQAGYTIVTNQHQLSINVAYHYEGKIGPQPFTLMFGSPIPIQRP